MRLPASAHAERPWRIHEVAAGFRVEDVWALPTPGGPEDFPRLVRVVAAFDPADASSFVVRMLFEIRWRLGELFGLDDPAGGTGGRVESLRERLPEDLRAAAGPELDGAPFTPLYLTADEFAAEVANRTVHGVLHLGWVRDGERWRGQMAVLVKRNGILGNAYMAAITPFRHLIVYPALMRDIGRAWRAALVAERAGAPQAD